MSKPGRPRTRRINLATWRKRHVTPHQLALAMNRSRRSIYYNIDKGALPVVKIGGLTMIRTDDARQFADIPAAISA